MSIDMKKKFSEILREGLEREASRAMWNTNSYISYGTRSLRYGTADNDINVLTSRTEDARLRQTSGSGSGSYNWALPPDVSAADFVYFAAAVESPAPAPALMDRDRALDLSDAVEVAAVAEPVRKLDI